MYVSTSLYAKVLDLFSSEYKLDRPGLETIPIPNAEPPPIRLLIQYTPPIMDDNTTISSSASLTIHLTSSSHASDSQEELDYELCRHSGRSSSNIAISSQSNPKDKKNKMKKKTIYFAYGSNLWQHQMHQRCPSSKFLGIVRLKGFKWIIYQRGFANIVEVDSHKEEEGTEKEEEKEEGDYRNQVWGMMYSLEEEDEKLLDEREGVPVAYRKEWIECEFWTVPEAAAAAASASSSREEEEEEVVKKVVDEEKKKRKPADITKRPGKEKMLVYINREMTDEGEIRKEYISRMNCGIKDAVKEGLPREYVEQVLRRWIPADGEEEEKKRVGGN